MATVIISSVELHAPTITAKGENTTRHVLNYVNQDGKEVSKSIYKFSPLYSEVKNLNLKKGDVVQLDFEKKGNYYNIVGISLAESAPEEAVKKSSSKTSSAKPTDYYADKDLSMELGGLMHDVVALIAAGKRTNLVSTLKELYTAKKEVAQLIKTGKKEKEVEAPKETPAKPSKQSDDWDRLENEEGLERPF